MEVAGAKGLNRPSVLFCSIPFMSCKIVLRVFLVPIEHHAIPSNLGDDGGSRDGGAELIPLSNRFLGNRNLDGLISVEEDEIWRERKVLDRQNHGFQSGLKDIKKIDLLVANDADAHSKSFGLNDLIKIFTFLRWYLF